MEDSFMDTIHIPLQQFRDIQHICAEHKNDPGELISILHAVQEIIGYLPQEVQEIIADEFSIPASKVYGVVTFYSFLP